jgi:PIN domain nuclease of toxin-antitoxin system
MEATMTANRFLPRPVTIPYALAVLALPQHHHDPFDWLLIAQARHEGLLAVSKRGLAPSLRGASPRFETASYNS